MGKPDTLAHANDKPPPPGGRGIIPPRRAGQPVPDRSKMQTAKEAAAAAAFASLKSLNGVGHSSTARRRQVKRRAMPRFNSPR